MESVDHFLKSGRFVPWEKKVRRRMKLLVLDGNSVVNRAFYGVSQSLATRDGQATGAIYGFLSILNKLLDQENPEALCITFDKKAPTFRHKLFAEYKGKRKPMPEDLVSQLPLLREVLTALNIPFYQEEGWEADDLMGTIARIDEEEDWETLIVTGDKDSFQLVTEKTSVHYVSTRMGRTSTKRMTPSSVEEEFGFAPPYIVDMKAIIGDVSDNIPGITGVGEKTIMPVLQELNSIDAIFEKLKDPEETLGLKKGMLAKVRGGEEAARLSYELATIRRDAPIVFHPKDCMRRACQVDALTEILTSLELHSLMKYYGLTVPPSESEQQLEHCQTELVTSLDRAKELLTQGESCPFLTAIPLPNLAGISLYFKDSQVCALFLEHELVDYGTFLRELFTNKSLNLVVQESKELRFLLLDEGIVAENIIFDVELAAYLLSPEEKSYDLVHLGKRHCKCTLESADHFQDSANLSPLGDKTTAYQIWSQHSALLAILYDRFLPQLQEKEMHKLYSQVELPLCAVLADMQKEGISVSRQALTLYGKKLNLRLKDLESAIITEAGEEFNINSPQQLGQILFEKMGLPPVKKTKTGYSTNVEVLEKLREDHPDCGIIALIMEQRQLSKLHSTYVKGLLKELSPMDKIHTKLQNTVTATGRLSSTEPNLQNIPIRTPLGAEIRHMFVAEQGKILVDADYSQIELRLLAHMAGDTAMISAFLSGEDIHSQTASQVFHVPVEEVTADMRRSSKAVNFGIVYGMSAFSLSQDIGVTVEEAKQYIKRYFDTYPQVKEFLDSAVQQAKTSGYSTTLYGRRRPIPELKSEKYLTRSFGERIAQNSPIQGTAADIIKMAMVAVSNRLKKENTSAKLVLQVHDELILQCDKEEQATISKLVQEEMEQVVSLAVPLSTETESGISWGDAH